MNSLNMALSTLHVEKQAYHGGSFIGNHVHKLVQVLVASSFKMYKLITHLQLIAKQR